MTSRWEKRWLRLVCWWYGHDPHYILAVLARWRNSPPICRRCGLPLDPKQYPRGR